MDWSICPNDPSTTAESDKLYKLERVAKSGRTSRKYYQKSDRFAVPITLKTPLMT
jgi:hypothetical protein